jgi:hypothetical protein
MLAPAAAGMKNLAGETRENPSEKLLFSLLPVLKFSRGLHAKS